MQCKTPATLSAYRHVYQSVLHRMEKETQKYFQVKGTQDSTQVHRLFHEVCLEGQSVSSSALNIAQIEFLRTNACFYSVMYIFESLLKVFTPIVSTSLMPDGNFHLSLFNKSLHEQNSISPYSLCIHFKTLGSRIKSINHI